MQTLITIIATVLSVLEGEAQKVTDDVIVDAVELCYNAGIDQETKLWTLTFVTAHLQMLYAAKSLYAKLSKSKDLDTAEEFSEADVEAMLGVAGQEPQPTASENVMLF